MAGRLDQPIGSKRTCYGCGTSYPDDVRFCPRDSVDLEYLPQSLDELSRDFRRPTRRASIAILSALLLIAACFIANRLDSTPAGYVPARGELTVRTNPVGAMVYLDGLQIGLSPVRLSDIPAGFHEVRAVFPGYSESQAQVQILPSSTHKLVWDLSPLPSRKVTDRIRFVAEFSREKMSPASKSSENLF